MQKFMRFPGWKTKAMTLSYDDAVIFDAIRRELSRGGQTIYLYNNGDDKRVVHKTLTGGYSIAAVLLETSSVINPRLKLAWNDNYVSCNYLYIPAFNRFYFINNISADVGGIAIIDAHVDVLKTYASAFETCAAVVTRETRSNKIGSVRSTYIPDNKLPISTGRSLKVIEFTGTDLNIDTATMTSTNFVLNVAGGGAITP